MRGYNMCFSDEIREIPVFIPVSPPYLEFCKKKNSSYYRNARKYWDT